MAVSPGPLDLADRELPPPFTSIRQVDETGSTNADLLADPGGPAGAVLVAGHQTSGRGRFQRSWEEPAGSSLLFSVRLRPAIPMATRGWLSLLTGVAVCDAVAARGPGADVGLKWPNDVLIGGLKVAGILAEAAGDIVVVGVGCNITQDAGQLPVPGATSLATSGFAVTSGPQGPDDRAELLFDVLGGLAHWLDALQAVGGDAAAAGLAVAYTDRCRTIGRRIEVERPGAPLIGTAVAIAGDGGLVVEPDGDGPLETVSAGDVTHLR